MRSTNDELRGAIRFAALGFALFVAGAAATMARAGVFDALLLSVAAVANLFAMLSICAVTAMMLDLGSPHSDAEPVQSIRVARRALQLSAVFWSAAGLVFLLTPALARF